MLYILGDFNVNLLNHKTASATGEYLNILYSSYFYRLIHKPTRVKDSLATLIDNTLTNSLSDGTKSGVLHVDLSDHFPIFHFSSVKIAKTNKTNYENDVQKAFE